MTISHYEPRPLSAGLEPTDHVTRWVQLLVPATELANAVAETDFVPEAIRGNPHAVAAVILYGDELGIGPMQALQSIDFIKGKPQPSAHLIRALIYRDGHSFLIHESTGVRCRVSGLRRGRPETERVFVTWDLDMARAAGLLGATNWTRYPRALLMARSTTELGRQVFPDVMRGLGGIAENVATVEETVGWAPDEQAGPAQPPVDQPVQRRPRKRPAKAPAVEAPSIPPGPRQPAPEEGTGQKPPADAPVAPTPAPEPAADPVAPPVPAEPVVPPKPASETLRRAYHAAFREAGVDPQDRELRLALTSLIVGRTVDSSTNLTRSEALKTTGTMAEVATGALAIEGDENGELRLVATRPEPPSGEEATS